MPYRDKVKARKYYREYAQACRDEMSASEKKEFYRQRYERDEEKYRLARFALRDKAIRKLGGRCSNLDCGWINSDGSFGCRDRRCLQIDHKNGGGTKERKRFGGSATAKIYKAVLADTTGRFQLLCANCNWIKLMDRKEYLVP